MGAFAGRMRTAVAAVVLGFMTLGAAAPAANANEPVTPPPQQVRTVAISPNGMAAAPNAVPITQAIQPGGGAPHSPNGISPGGMIVAPRNEHADSIAEAAEKQTLLARIVNDVAWRALTKNDVKIPVDFSIGDAGTLDVEVFVDVDETDWNTDRRAFARKMQRNDLETVWLKSGGRATLEAAHEIDGTFGIDGEAELSYRVLRPYTYEKDRERTVDLARALALNTITLPLNADLARQLEQGAEFELKGRFELEAEHDGVVNVDPNATGNFELEIRKRSDDRVQVTLELELDATVAFLHDGRADGGAKVTASTDLERSSRRVFDIDLGTPAGQRAYDALMKLRSGPARDAAKKTDSGVVMSSERFEKGFDVSSTVEGELSEDTDLRARIHFGRSETEDRTKTQLDGDATITHQFDERTSGRATVRFENRDEVAKDGTKTKHREVGVAGSGQTTLDGETPTNLTVGGSVARERTLRTPPGVDAEMPTDLEEVRDLPDGVDYREEVERKGNAGLSRGNLTASAAIESGFEIVKNSWRSETVRDGELNLAAGYELENGLGFDAEREIGFRFELPLSAERDLPLPLAGSTAQTTPKGASFRLYGSGTFGIDKTHDFAPQLGELEAELGFQRKGMVRVDVDFEGDGKVEIDVNLDTTSTLSRALDYSRAFTERDTTVAVDYDGKTDVTTDKNFEFELDLEQAPHREAYSALMRGDVGPALLIAGVEDLAKPATTSNDGVEVEVRQTSWGGASIELERNQFAANHWRVRYDEHRNAYSEEATAAGKSVHWVERSGAFSPRLGKSHTVPLVGDGLATPNFARLRAGFESIGLARYTSMAPVVDGRDVYAGPAWNADGADDLPRGAEFTVEGQGSFKGFVELRGGFQYGTTGATIGGSAGLEITKDSTGSIEITVKKEDDRKVRVTLQQGKLSQRALELFVKLGVDIDAAALVADVLPADPIGAAEMLSAALEKKLDRLLVLELVAELSHRDEHDRSVELVLDLSKPGARRAYDQLFRFDGNLAKQLSQRSGAGVEIVSVRDDREIADETNVELAVAGETLYLLEALRSDRTIIETRDGSTTRQDTSKYERRRELPWRERSVAWEAVSVRKDGDPVGRSYYRLTLDDEDDWTSGRQARDLLSFAKSLGAEPVRTPVVTDADGFTLFGRHGKTETDIELFVTEAAIEKIRTLDHFEALRAYGQAIYQRDGKPTPLWAGEDVEVAKKAQDILRRYYEEGDEFSNSRDEQDRQRSLEVEYYWDTGREMYKDRKYFEAAMAFAEMAARMNDHDDPAEWNAAYANLGETVKFDFYDAFAVIASVVGAEEIVVHDLQMKGKAVDIEMKDEGLLRRPQA